MRRANVFPEDLRYKQTEPDGHTIWLSVSATSPVVEARQLSDGTREEDKDFTTLVQAGNQDAEGIWSDGTTMWVVDNTNDKIYSYVMVVTIDPNLGDDRTLRQLRLSPAAIPSFTPDTNIYHVGVANSVSRITVSPTTGDPKATFEISPADASSASGHQVDLLPGPTDINIRVTAENTLTNSYRVTVFRGSDQEFERSGAGDTDLRADGQSQAHSFTGAGNTFWAASPDSDSFNAFNRNGARNASRDIALASDNENPAGLWTDGTHLWVADNEDDKIYVYRTSNGQRQADREWALDADNGSPTGLWSDRTTIWVADTEDRKLYAYRLADGQRDADRDINPGHPLTGIWSDGAVMWVSDPTERRVLAYNLHDGQRHPELDFNTPADSAGHVPQALWGNANTLWITDVATGQAYAYNMPSKNFLQRASTPRAPRDFSLETQPGSDAITVQWSLQYSDPRAPITVYRLRYRQEGSPRWTTINHDAGQPNEFDIPVTQWHLYEVQLAAVSRLGESSAASGKTVYHPEQSWRANAADRTLGVLGAYWSDQHGSLVHHPDHKPLNVNTLENSCLGTAPFVILWDKTRQIPEAVEAHFITTEGVWRITYESRIQTDIDSQQLYLAGTATMHGDTYFSFRARARRAGENWGRWSEIASLYCDAVPGTAGTFLTLQGERTDAEQSPDNTPPIGEPIIRSTVLAPGETLFALTPSIDDADGMEDAVLTYQWLRNPGEHPIPGATSLRYTITEDDVNTQLSVRVSFTDDAGNDESLTSRNLLIPAPRPLRGGVDAATVPQSHDGTAAFEFQIHFSVAPDLDSATVRVHVLTVTGGRVTAAERTLHNGERSSVRWTITLQPDGGEDITVSMGPTTDCSHQGAVCTDDGRMLLNRSQITVPAVLQSPTQEPSPGPITGFTLLDASDQTILHSLTAGSTARVADPGAGSYAIRADVQAGSTIGSVVMELTGTKAVSRTENFAPYSIYGDEGESALAGGNLPTGQYTLRATAYSGARAGGDELGTLEVSFTVANASTPAGGRPTITGTPDVGRALTAGTSQITDADGTAGATFSYQWLRSGTAISGATGPDYTPAQDDIGADISVRVTFTDDLGNPEALTSAAVTVPQPLTAAISATYPYGAAPTQHPGHDGAAAFTVYLALSAQVSVGFAAVRDHVLPVTNGTITRAQRTDPGATDRNRVWTITIQPSSDADVVIALAPTTDCEDAAAVCTSEGRRQSSNLEYTVPGP